MNDELALQIDHLSKEFKTGNLRIQALPSISLNLQRNERLLLSGENGCGKTTLLKILSTLIKPTSGTCRILGYDIHQVDHIRQKIAYIPDKLDFDFSLTGFKFWKQISFCRGKESDTEYFLNLIDQLGLNSWLHRQIGAYSLGMKKRLMIAIWLSLKPDLLLLDEFDSGLDSDGKLVMENLFFDLTDITILGISHVDNLKLGRNMRKAGFTDLLTEEVSH